MCASSVTVAPGRVDLLQRADPGRQAEEDAVGGEAALVVLAVDGGQVDDQVLDAVLHERCAASRLR